MFNYYRTEVLKWKRRKLWIIFAALMICSLLLHFQIPRNIHQQESGIAVDATLVFMSLYPVLYLIQIAVAGVLGCMLFSQEYQYNTYIQLKTIPLSPSRYIGSKLLWLNTLVLIMALEHTIALLCVSLYYRLPLTLSFFLFHLLSGIVSSVLITMGTVPFLLLAILCRRNAILPPIAGFLGVLPILMANMGNWAVSRGSALEWFMQYIYPVSSNIMIYMKYLYHFISPEMYELHPPDISLPLAMVCLLSVTILFLILEGLLIRKSDA